MKDKIMKESIDLFDSKGFSKTSIQDIVDNIGVTKGTFYYYFESKQELLRDIHLSFIENLLHQQEEIINDKNLNNKEKLYKLVYIIISEIKTSGKSARVFNREIRHLEKDHIDNVNSKRREFRLNFQKVIDEGIREGEFRNDLRSDIVTFAILGMVNRSYSWYNPDGEMSEDEIVNLYMELILNGLTK